jgi:hypothetical protein
MRLLSNPLWEKPVAPAATCSNCQCAGWCQVIEGRHGNISRPARPFRFFQAPIQPGPSRNARPTTHRTKTIRRETSEFPFQSLVFLLVKYSSAQRGLIPWQGIFPCQSEDGKDAEAPHVPRC